LLTPTVPCPPISTVRKHTGDGPDFRSATAATSQLFTKDPEFWKSVHLGGDEQEAVLAAAAAAAKKEWRDKLKVEDPHLHTYGVNLDTPTQVRTLVVFMVQGFNSGV
jgi:hypothetical protein